MARVRRPQSSVSRWNKRRNAELLYRFVMMESGLTELSNVYGIAKTTTGNILVREGARVLASLTGDKQLPLDLLRQAILDREGTAAKLRTVLALSPGEVADIVKKLPREQRERINGTPAITVTATSDSR